MVQNQGPNYTLAGDKTNSEHEGSVQWLIGKDGLVNAGDDVRQSCPLGQCLPAKLLYWLTRL